MYVKFLSMVWKVLSYYFFKLSADFSLFSFRYSNYSYICLWLNRQFFLEKWTNPTKAKFPSSNWIISMSICQVTHCFFCMVCSVTYAPNVFFIWFTEFFSSRMSVWFFLIISVSLIKDFWSLMLFLSFLVAYWISS